MAASRVGYTMAVPAPSRTAATAPGANVVAVAVQARAAAASPSRNGAGRGPQAVVGGEGAGGGGGAGEGEVAGGFVESHGQAAAVGAGEVDFHDDGGGPGQSLVDAEQDVGGDDPAPGGCSDEQQGYGQAGEPAGEQDGFAAVAVGQGTGEEVGDRLGGAEDEDVGERGGVGGGVEVVFGEQLQDGAFLSE